MSLDAAILPDADIVTILSDKFIKIIIKFSAFNSTVWFDTISQVTIRWKKVYSDYVRRCAELSIPLHVIYYEQLKENTTAQVREILKFYKEATGFEPENVESRIECINQVFKTLTYIQRKFLDWQVFAKSHLRTISKWG